MATLYLGSNVKVCVAKFAAINRLDLPGEGNWFGLVEPKIATAADCIIYLLLMHEKKAELCKYGWHLKVCTRLAYLTDGLAMGS